MDLLRRKLTVRAHGRSLVLIKRPVESVEHVVQKALLWALYLPAYPRLRVEVPLPDGSRYKPDLLALDDASRVVFWGECGVVAFEKLCAVLRRHRAAHVVFSKWATRLDPFAALVTRALTDVPRIAPVELVAFPESARDAIGDDGSVTIDRASLEIRRWDVAGDGRSSVPPRSRGGRRR